MKSPIHFYLTFNPHLNKNNDKDYTQAHEFYDFLKDTIQNKKSDKVYWGKIIGKDRKSQLDPNIFSKIIKENLNNNLSTHLYITDFNNIWVAKVTDALKSIPNKKLALSFYEDKNVEIWFEISDMTLLEHDSKKTAKKLSELYIDNENMELVIDELSPFTTGIKYPCFVQDLREEQYFDDFASEENLDYSHLAFKYNPGVSNTSTGQIIKCINNYAIPEEIYNKIPHAAKIEIESSEIDMMEQRHHNMGRIAFSYLKVLELTLNHLIIGHIKRTGHGNDFFVDTTSFPPKLFFEKNHNNMIPLKQFHKNFSIGSLLYFIERSHHTGNLSFKRAFSKNKKFIQYFINELQKEIQENKFIEIRNALAHNESDINYAEAINIRNLILGVGCRGILNYCFQSFYGDSLSTSKGSVETEGANKTNKAERKSGLKLVS